jgi:hypothetical protein
MGDRAPCSITIGGDLSADHLPRFLSLIEDYGLTIDWGGEPFEFRLHPVATPIALFGDEINGGCVDDVESFCVEHGLPFRRVSGGCLGAFSPEIIVFYGAKQGVQRFDADDDGSMVMTADAVLRAKSLTDLQARVIYAKRDIPPFIIMPAECST